MIPRLCSGYHRFHSRASDWSPDTNAFRSCAVLRDTKLHRANPRDQRTLAIASAVAEPGFRSFALRRISLSASVISASSAVSIAAFTATRRKSPSCQQGFDIDNLALTLNLGRGVLPRQRVGDVRYRPQIMATVFLLILQNSRTLPWPTNCVLGVCSISAPKRGSDAMCSIA